MSEGKAFPAGKDALAMLVAIRHGVPSDSQAFHAMLPKHLAFQNRLEVEGIMFCSGPTSSGDGLLNGQGLTILQNISLDEAQALWADEPFYKAGIRSAEFLSWRVNEATTRLQAILPTTGRD
jgi:uncharacterized protein